jgi:hypothetical protein
VPPTERSGLDLNRSEFTLRVIIAARITTARDRSVADTGSMPSPWRTCAKRIGSARRRWAIIARNSTSPASLKNSYGRRSLVSSPSAHDDQRSGNRRDLRPAGLRPQRYILSWKPSATAGEEHVEFAANIVPLAR